jgi:eukaryotic-like serine/threonine-protein kinase
MPLDVGQQLGPYQILSTLGAGGMGEVYRARDTRLGRAVAVKVLPRAVASSPDALARFEREARAVAALAHPNILTIHDFGQEAGTAYAVMELLQGETLRSRLSAGPLGPRKAVEIAVQIARGLAAAHDRQIAHRDLKPENIFITTDGSVKILDFGLARTAISAVGLTALDSPTVAPSTEPGTVLGTVGYMAPEQVRGDTVDHRADIFALGCVLYEMLTAQRAFQHGTAAETMTAILREEPPDPDSSAGVVPPGLVRTLRRCLEKRPEERYQSARDLSFALETTLDATGGRSGPQAMVPDRLRWFRAPYLVLAAGILIGALGTALTMARRPTVGPPAETPRFRPLTFDRGTVREARFAPDGRTVIYAAAWEGNPVRTFLTRTDSGEAVRVNLPDAQVLSVSSTGEMAISLGHTYEGWMGEGTLARSPLLGGSPKPLVEHVREADWSPDGAGMAIIRRVNGVERLEFPIGHSLYETSGYISHIRFSPSGERIAFADHPLFADDAGGVSVVDRKGTRTRIAYGYNEVRGLAWAPGGEELWFTAIGPSDAGPALMAASMTGQLRVVFRAPVQLLLFDVGKDGRVLLGTEQHERRIEALLAGDSAPHEVSLRGGSESLWISPDAAMMTITDFDVPGYDSYLLRASSAAPVRVGRGQAFGVSSDGRWLAAVAIDTDKVFIHPTGAGESRELPNPDKLLINAIGWLPDAKGLVLFAQPIGQRSRGYVQQIAGGPPRAFTPEGVGLADFWSVPISPDGTRVVMREADGRIMIRPFDGGSPQAITGLRPDDVPTQWSADGRSVFVVHGTGRPWVVQVERLDVTTGAREKAFEVRPAEIPGLRLTHLVLARDGRHYAHSYARAHSVLYVVDGLR